MPYLRYSESSGTTPFNQRMATSASCRLEPSFLTISGTYKLGHDVLCTRTIYRVQIEAMVVKKGFTPEQLRTALDEYQQLGVLRIDSDRSRILLDGMI
jgi:hypothetical protein